MQDQISRSSRSASPIHSSTEQKTIFVNNYSNVRVVRSITRFDGARLSYALVRSNCNKLVITWPLGRLANLSPSAASRPRVINQPAPSWPCYNYYLQRGPKRMSDILPSAVSQDHNMCTTIVQICIPLVSIICALMTQWTACRLHTAHHSTYRYHSACKVLAIYSILYIDIAV